MPLLRGYRRWHALLDAVGALSILSCVLYATYGHRTGDAEIKDIWSGVSTELVGAWLTARAIEFWLRRSEQIDTVRIRVLRNLRFYLNLSTRCVEYLYRPELRQLEREIAWTRKFFARHHDAFDPTEISDIEDALAWVDELRQELAHMWKARQDKNDEQLNASRARALDIVESLDVAVRKAEDNILEETAEAR